jgi:hypothetical protein
MTYYEHALKIVRKRVVVNPPQNDNMTFLSWRQFTLDRQASKYFTLSIFFPHALTCAKWFMDSIGR